MNIKSEEVEIKNEPEVALTASSSNEGTRDVKADPERQWVVCLGDVGIKKEPLGRTCEKCGQVTMVKNHKCKIHCKICNKKLATKNGLIKHMQNVHRAEPDCKFFECDFCGLRLLKKHFLIRHLKLKHEGGKIDEFQCDYDGKIFTSKARLCDHMKKCQSASSNCKICGKEVKHLESHMRYVHPIEKITVACKICGKTFQKKKSLALHLKVHNKQFECHLCKKKFSIASKLKTHLKVHENSRAFQCKICFKSFNDPSTLSQHMKTHDKKNRIKSLKCEHCDYATYTSAQLKSHLKVHDANRIKDLKCPTCKFATDNNGVLKRHIETHNPHRTKYPCPHCDYKATTFSDLKFHMKTHNPNRIKDQKCPHCDFMTDNKRCLTAHIKTHDKNRAKNFKCLTCEKSFYNDSDFKKHVKTHNENSLMFSCQLCNYKTIRKDYLKIHIAKVHNEKKTKG
jgi:KRAB domain-containing zinc finger protein